MKIGVQKEKKREKTRKFRVALRRIFAKIELFFVFAIFMIFCAGLAYYIMAYAVWCLEMGQIGKILDVWRIWKHWECMKLWYKLDHFQTEGYVPTIVGASASLLITMTTIIQAHYTRAQDRVMGFPKNYINEISVGLDVSSNVEAVRKYFDPISAKTVIEFSFKEGFSTYYTAVPFRLFVCLSKMERNKEKQEWESLPIYNFQYSNLLDENPDNCEVLLETGDSVLLQKYCTSTNENDGYKLKIILDIQWKNNLIPKWRRMLGDMYIREEIKVDGIQKNKKKTKRVLPYKYDVLYTEHRKAYLASWILLKRSKDLLTDRENERKQDRKIDELLKERQGEQGQ